MSKSSVLVIVLIALAAIAAAVAPVLTIRYALVQPGLSRAAKAFVDDPSCRRIGSGSSRDPRKAIAGTDLTSSPCALTGAMVVDKAYTGGAGATYSLGLRDDAGRDRIVSLGGDGDAALWNRTSAGTRVILQTYRGRTTSVADGVSRVPTRENPEFVAHQNMTGVAVCGALTLLEVIGLAIVIAALRRST